MRQMLEPKGWLNLKKKKKKEKWMQILSQLSSINNDQVNKHCFDFIYTIYVIGPFMPKTVIDEMKTRRAAVTRSSGVTALSPWYFSPGNFCWSTGKREAWKNVKMEKKRRKTEKGGWKIENERKKSYKMRRGPFFWKKPLGVWVWVCVGEGVCGVCMCVCNLHWAHEQIGWENNVLKSSEFSLLQ